MRVEETKASGSPAWPFALQRVLDSTNLNLFLGVLRFDLRTLTSWASRRRIRFELTDYRGKRVKEWVNEWVSPAISETYQHTSIWNRQYDCRWKVLFSGVHIAQYEMDNKKGKPVSRSPVSASASVNICTTLSNMTALVFVTTKNRIGD